MHWNLIRIFSQVGDSQRAVSVEAAIVAAMEGSSKVDPRLRANITLDYARAVETNAQPEDAMLQAKNALALMLEHGATRAADQQDAEDWIREHGG